MLPHSHQTNRAGAAPSQILPSAAQSGIGYDIGWSSPRRIREREKLSISAKIGQCRNSRPMAAVHTDLVDSAIEAAAASRQELLEILNAAD
jgi:hypothetical protein